MKNKVINLLKTLKVDVNLDKWPKELAVYKNDDNVINQMIEQLEYIDDLEEVIEKIEINDYKSLENIFLNAATEQYRVQNNLSLAHYFFNDVNLSTYHYWISKSAENNDLMSYYNIIYDMFLKGDYEKETVLSVNEYLGDCGVYLGYQNLGYLYSKDNKYNICIDLDKAYDYYLKAIKLLEKSNYHELFDKNTYLIDMCEKICEINSNNEYYREYIINLANEVYDNYTDDKLICLAKMYIMGKIDKTFNIDMTQSILDKYIKCNPNGYNKQYFEVTDAIIVVKAGKDPNVYRREDL